MLNFNKQDFEKYFIKFKKNLSEKNYKENIPFVSIGIVSGIVCCGYAVLFSEIEKKAQEIFSMYPISIFLVAPVFLLAAFLVINKFASGASGSGIPQVITCIEKENKGLSDKFLSVRVALMKVLSSSLAIFGGAAIGREGPSLQISAAIGHNLGIFFEKAGIRIKNEQLIIAGAASGLAAAFNTPVGGIVYAVEELTHDHIRSYKTVLLMSVLIAGFTAQLIVGNYLYLGYPQVAGRLLFNTIIIASIISFLSGMLGAIFSKILFSLNIWFKEQIFIKKIFIVLGIGFCIATIYYFFGERSIFSGKDSINFILFERDNASYTEFIFRFFSPILSSMTGIAGGIFAPALSSGAAFGGMMADFFDPTLRVLLGLSGMIGFLTGVTRTPITSFVLVLEMTDRHSVVFPMMLAAVFSSLGAHLIGNKSYYEEMADWIK